MGQAMTPKGQLTRATEKKKVGRPPLPYDVEIGEEICELVADGSNLHRICSAPDFPYGKDTIRRWLVDIPEFTEKYARARESRADARADRIDDIVEKVLDGRVDAHAARVAIDAEKWQAGHECWKRYGPKVEIEGKLKHEGQYTLADLVQIAQQGKTDGAE